MLEYCRVRGGSEPQIIRDSTSAATTSRPGLESMLARVRSGDVHEVVTCKLDRLGRSLTQFTNTLDCHQTVFLLKKLRLGLTHWGFFVGKKSPQKHSAKMLSRRDNPRRTHTLKALPPP
ncbi:MAG: recombinase family protein, partial [Betaproteobacteria bacterium]|nr:recombinase family protein [Betaproteobacteria bacterium]